MYDYSSTSLPWSTNFNAKLMFESLWCCCEKAQRWQPLWLACMPCSGCAFLQLQQHLKLVSRVSVILNIYVCDFYIWQEHILEAQEWFLSPFLLHCSVGSSERLLKLPRDAASCTKPSSCQWGSVAMGVELKNQGKEQPRGNAWCMRADGSYCLRLNPTDTATEWLKSVTSVFKRV